MVQDVKTQVLREVAQKDVVKFGYTKADGTDRKVIGTLNPDIIPAVHLPHTALANAKPTSNTHLVVFDLEKNGWRSLIIDNIYAYEVLKDWPEGV